MKKFFHFVLLAVVFWFPFFAYAEDPVMEAQAFNQKLFWIEQKVSTIQETQKQIAEKQAQIKKELDSLRILINRFR